MSTPLFFRDDRRLDDLDTETLRQWALSDYLGRETKARALRLIERRTFDDAYAQGKKGELEDKT